MECGIGLPALHCRDLSDILDIEKRGMKNGCIVIEAEENIMQQKKGKGSIWIWRLLVLLIWSVMIAVLFIHRKNFTISEILEFTPENPFMAALTMLLFFALKSLSIVLFSGILYAVNGILFPLPIAVLLNILGTAIMVTIPYAIGKKGGSVLAERIVAKFPKADRLWEFRRKNDFFFVLIVRLAGILPCDVVSLYMGAIHVNYFKYLIGCLIGMLPPSITFPIMGMSITDTHSPQFIIAFCMELLLMASSVFVYRMYRKKEKAKTQKTR